MTSQVYLDDVLYLNIARAVGVDGHVAAAAMPCSDDLVCAFEWWILREIEGVERPYSASLAVDFKVVLSLRKLIIRLRTDLPRGSKSRSFGPRAQSIRTQPI